MMGIPVRTPSSAAFLKLCFPFKEEKWNCVPFHLQNLLSTFGSRDGIGALSEQKFNAGPHTEIQTKNELSTMQYSLLLQCNCTLVYWNLKVIHREKIRIHLVLRVIYNPKDTGTNPKWSWEPKTAIQRTELSRSKNTAL